LSAFSNGSFSVAAFSESAYDFGSAPPPTPPAASNSGGYGGWWPDFEHVQRQRAKRKREIEELEAEAERIADATTREIYRLERERDAKEADADDLVRLQALADQYAGKVQELSKDARIAILNAQDARTRNALEQMRRVVERELNDEMLAIQQVVLLLMVD